jgi:hypothetical protein
MDGQSVQLDVFFDPKRNIYPTCDLISKSLAYRHTRDSQQPGEEPELGGRLRKFLFRFWFAVRKKLIPSHRLPCLIEHTKHDADFFEVVTSIYYVADLTAYVEQVCETTHDKIPSSIIHFLNPRPRNEISSRSYCHGAGERLGRRRQLLGCSCQSRLKKNGRIEEHSKSQASSPRSRWTSTTPFRSIESPKSARSRADRSDAGYPSASALPPAEAEARLRLKHSRARMTVLTRHRQVVEHPIRPRFLRSRLGRLSNVRCLLQIQKDDAVEFGFT